MAIQFGQKPTEDSLDGAEQPDRGGDDTRPRRALRTLPETGYLRLRQIIGESKADPPVPPLIPVGKTTWWDGVKSGRFPKPVKLGPRTTAWRVEDIRKLIEDLRGETS